MKDFTKPTFVFSLLTAAICTIAGGTLWSIIQDQISRNIAKSETWTLAFIVLCFALLVVMMHYVVHQVDDLHKKSRIRIRYYSWDDADGVERIASESRKFIEQAAENGTGKIIAVNSFIEIFQESNEPKSDKSRDNYFRTIECKLDKVDYHRIVQLKNSSGYSDEISKRIDKSYKEHFVNTIKRRDSQKSERMVRLDYVNARVNASKIWLGMCLRLRHTGAENLQHKLVV